MGLSAGALPLNSWRPVWAHRLRGFAYLREAMRSVWCWHTCPNPPATPHPNSPVGPTDRPTVRLTDHRTDRLTDHQAGQPADQPAGRLGLPVGGSVGQSVGWSVGRSAGLSIGPSAVGRSPFVSRSVGRPSVGRSVSSSRIFKNWLCSKECSKNWNGVDRTVGGGKL